MPDTETVTQRVDRMLAALAPGQRAALQSLRETIALIAPDAEEAISYGMPAFRYRDKALVAYGAFAHHCAFYPMSGTLIEEHRDALGAFATAKGTLQFTPAEPLPRSVVELVVRARMTSIDAH